jgi:hypothetical protein
MGMPAPLAVAELSAIARPFGAFAIGHLALVFDVMSQ